MAKRTFPFLITPRCPFSWAHVHEPDRKFQTDGEYHITCVLNEEENQVLLAKIEEIRDEQYPILAEQEGMKVKGAEGKGKVMKLGNLPWKIEEDEDGEPTGNVTLRPKMKALVRYTRDGAEKTFEQRPDIVDASGTARVKQPIGGGSEGKVKFEIVPYYTALVGMGVTLRLKAVQVLSLVPFGGNNLEGFEEEEGFAVDASEEVDGLAAITTGEDTTDGDF